MKYPLLDDQHLLVLKVNGNYRPNIEKKPGLGKDSNPGRTSCAAAHFEKALTKGNNIQKKVCEIALTDFFMT